MDEKRYKQIIDNSKDFITLINREYVYELVNDTYCEAIERKKEELIGATVEEVWGKEKFYNTIKDYIDRCFAGEHVQYVEEFHFGPFLKYMHVSYYPYDEGNKVTHVMVFSHDITHIGKLESKLNHYEYRDPVTGLFNRRSLDIILDRELARVHRLPSDDLRVLMFIELRNIEKTIELYGQDFGDLLIENAGLKIQEQIRSSDYVFRYEGNQFVVLLCNIKNEFGTGKVAKKIYDTVTLPYHYRENDIIIGCSIGAAVYPYDAEEKEELVQKATSAMLEANRNDRAYILYDKKMYDEAFRRIELETAAYRALAEQQFQLHYQPIVDDQFHIVGAEALLRWRHPTLGDVPPMHFIPIAEQSDLIFAIGKWVLFSVCKQIEKWSKQYNIYLTFNMSSKEFSVPNLVDMVREVSENGVPIDKHYLKIEITENECVDNIDSSVARIKALEQLGIEVYIDDFGTGNSSLQYLKMLPARVLKIDRDFIHEIEKKRGEREFLNHIVNMAQIRGKNVLIEGVENREQAHILLGMGCRAMQGYYFSKPVDADTFEALLQNGVDAS
jgi:diguanylate cyclase (GGDEF)-like protein/PAS domain S-box-containing protein